MKKVFAYLVLMVVVLNLYAQAPQRMSYQCIVRNGSGTLVTNQSVGIRISILQGTISGTVVYQETYNPNPQTNANGLVSLEIGSGLYTTKSFSTIDWASGPYFLKTETDPTGGTNYTIVGTSQLLSVPYALYAGNGISNSVLDGLKLQIKGLEDNLIASGTYKLIDIEGNQYKVVKIGNQVWMAENLKVTHYNDGTSIPYFGQYSYDNQHSYDGYGWYNNDPSTYKNTYGALYNFPAVGTHKLCPTGWQVPSESEWDTLITFLGGDLVAGGKLKETGTTHWNTPNTGAINETGFTALPGGMMFTEGGSFNNTFQQMGTNGYWWSRKQQVMVEPESFYERLDYNLNNSYGWIQYVWNGLSVRCLKNSGPTLTTDSVIVTRTDAGVCIVTVKSGGHIINDNGLVITHKSICWGGRRGDENIGGGTDEGGGSDNFKSTFSTSCNGMYRIICIRAYATNAAGTGYGNEICIGY